MAGAHIEPAAIRDLGHGYFPAPSTRFLRKARRACPLLLAWVLTRFSTAPEAPLLNSLVFLLFEHYKLTARAVLLWAWALATTTGPQRRLLTALHNVLYRLSVSEPHRTNVFAENYSWSRVSFKHPTKLWLRYGQRFLQQLSTLGDCWGPNAKFPRTPICHQCGGHANFECHHCSASICLRCANANAKLQSPATRCTEWGHLDLL